MASSMLCSICEKVFSTTGNLKKHCTQKHAENKVGLLQGFSFEDALFKCLEGCDLSFKTHKDLRQHLDVQHDFEIVLKLLEFSTFEEFNSWLQVEEHNNNIRFYKPRASKRSTHGEVEKFSLMCSRSGKQVVVSEDLRKRKEKCQGSSKYNIGCTSQIIVTRDTSSNKCSVLYYFTHYGHGEEIKHIRISKMCRKEVAQKLKIGVSASALLGSKRDNINEELNRDDILTRKDINNIKTSFNIKVKEEHKHQDDATSVFLWVEKCTSSAIINKATSNNELQVNELVNGLRRSTSTNSSADLLSSIRTEILKLQNNLDNLNYTTEEHQHIYKHLKSLCDLGSTSFPANPPFQSMPSKLLRLQ